MHSEPNSERQIYIDRLQERLSAGRSSSSLAFQSARINSMEDMCDRFAMLSDHTRLMGREHRDVVVHEAALSDKAEQKRRTGGAYDVS